MKFGQVNAFNDLLFFNPIKHQFLSLSSGDAPAGADLQSVPFTTVVCNDMLKWISYKKSIVA